MEMEDDDVPFEEEIDVDENVKDIAGTSDTLTGIYAHLLLILPSKHTTLS